MIDFASMFNGPTSPSQAMTGQPAAPPQRQYDGAVRMPGMEPPSPKQQIRKMLSDLLDNL